MMKKIILLISVISQIVHAEKVLILTHAYNRPEFIAIQHKTFQKFLSDDYEYVVFNDARTQDMATQIETACHEVGVRCIRIPQEIHTQPYLPRLPKDNFHRPNIRHANNTQYSFDVLAFDHDGIVLVIDSDMFLVRPLNITEYMEDKDVSALIKTSNATVWYLCPALSFFHMNKLPNKRSLNFNCGLIDNKVSVDSGGWTYYYFRDNPGLRVAAVDAHWSYNLYLGNSDIHKPVDHKTPDHIKIEKYTRLGFNEKEILFFLKKPDTFEYYLDKHFFHYHAGSNHDKKPSSYHIRKFNIFKEYIDDILST